MRFLIIVLLSCFVVQCNAAIVADRCYSDAAEKEKKCNNEKKASFKECADIRHNDEDTCSKREQIERGYASYVQKWILGGLTFVGAAILVPFVAPWVMNRWQSAKSK